MFRYVSALMLAAAAGSAWGQTVGFDLSGGSNFTVGQTVTLQLDGSGFAGGLAEGGLELQFNSSVLHLESISINSDFDQNSTVAGSFFPSATIDNTAGTASSIDFASIFSGTIPTGNFDIGSFTFVVEAASASSALSLGEDSSFGPWVAGDYATQITPSFKVADISTSTGVIGAVPEPPTVWLLAVAAVGALALRRRLVPKCGLRFG